MKILFVSTQNNELQGVTLEDVMDALEAKKLLNLEEKQKASMIEDINEANKILAGYDGLKPRNIPTTFFDTMWDMNLKELQAIYTGLQQKISYKRYQGNIQGQDF